MKINIKKLSLIHYKEIDKSTIFLTDECWCERSYPRHKKGCINYGKDLCPPNAPHFKDKIDNYNYFYLIYVKLDFKTYLEIREAQHNDWSDAQLRNLRHWQKSVQNILKDKIKPVFLSNINQVPYLLFCGSGLIDITLNQYQKKIFSMEAMGINVFSTLRKNKIFLELFPENHVILVSMICSKEPLNFNKQIQKTMDYYGKK